MRNHLDQPAIEDRPEQAGLRRPQPPAWLTAIHSTDRRTSLWHPLTRTPLTPSTERAARIAVNLIGAASAALFAQASLQFYAHTHRLIGGLFVIEQTWFAVAFLIRRPPRAVSGRIGSWLLAGGGLSAPCCCGQAALICRGACTPASASNWLAWSSPSPRCWRSAGHSASWPPTGA